MASMESAFSLRHFALQSSISKLNRTEFAVLLFAYSNEVSHQIFHLPNIRMMAFLAFDCFDSPCCDPCCTPETHKIAGEWIKEAADKKKSAVTQKITRWGCCTCRVSDRFIQINWPTHEVISCFSHSIISLQKSVVFPTSYITLRLTVHHRRRHVNEI